MEKIEIEEEEAREPIPGEYGHPIPREIMFRELGFTEPYSRFSVGRRVVSSTLATKAVHTLCTKETVNRRKFKLPAGARTTFHMAFSADGTKLASCHGDHNVYVCDVRNGEVLQTLSGHPRTPWCVVFHPTQNDILASGCLAGHIRVWDLNGGSEVLVTDSGTVIASLAFHPTVRLLAIATFNEIIFWDWGLPYPLARCSTENTKEKVRLVRFDRLGKSLITGITNFPNPPVREGLQVPTTSANHRPNILSRGNSRSGTVNFFVHERPEMNDPRDGPVDVTDDPEDRSNDPHSHGEILAASLAAAAEAEAASAVFNRRQDRFQESYRQLVNHYQDLVSHYQQFLRSRIPRLLETSRIVREQPGQPATDVQNPTPPVAADTDVTMSEPSSGVQTEASVQIENPTPADDELPGPSRLIQLEARLLEIINTPESSSSESTSQSSTTAAATENSSIPNRLRNDTDLRNIEMLAQNILEMQNLCSQARRDAPLTIETQHIIELQNIRRHLELLQEQTRELQSSIRATLTSLARGSLDALRSHVTNNPSHTSSLTSLARGSLDALRSHVTPTNTNPAPAFPSVTNSTAASSHGISRSSPMGPSNQSSPANSNAILRITIGPRLTASAELIPPSNGIGASSGPTRTQVPPAITMQYELPDGTSRGPTSISLGSIGDPIPGTSRSTGRSSGDPSSQGPRRIIREFHVVSGRGAGDMEQHARNCPFSGRDQPQRPPPRMRCMTEMGETPTLTVWPTIETGMELETRNFRSVGAGRELLRQNDTRVVIPVIQDPRVTVDPFGPSNLASSYPNNQSNTLASSYFNQGYLGGPNWISNDVGVHVFLTIRRVADSVRRNRNVFSTDNSDLESENWQRLFPAGFAFINQLARQGNRPDRRSHGREIPRGLFSCRGPRHRSESNYSYGRPGIWDDLLRSNSTSQFLPSTSCASTASSSTTTSSSSSGNSQSSRNIGRPLPQRINGNFVLIYYMRAGEEVIPVYSLRPDNHDFSETVAMREGPLLNVFVFPIGLFLRGSSWENGTQTVGIYWPPVSRDEEQNLSDFRRSDSLVPVYTTNIREPSVVQRSENLVSSRYHITYDSDQMQILLPRGGSIVIVQPGLLVLDAVTTAANFDRPRSVEGTLYVNHISPILEALERLFGFRQRNQILSSATVNSSPSPSRPPMHPGWVRPPHNPYRGWINSSSVSNPRQFPEGAEPVIVRHGGMNGMLVRRNGSEPSFVPIYTPGEARVGLERIDRAPGERTRRTLPEDDDVNTTPRAGSGSGNNATGGSGGPSNVSRPPPWPTTGSRSSMPENLNPSYDSGEGGSEGMSSTRRVIRLAVDTATADILRRDHQQNARGHITRAIESRIERVLNERGNRGISEYPPSYLNSMVYLPVSSINWSNSLNQDNTEAYVQDRQLRLEDIQLRISMLTQWSQQSRQASTSVTSGTQTNASFLQSASQGSSSAGNSSANSTPSTPPTEGSPAAATLSRDSPLRASRRRPYPRTQTTTTTPTSGAPPFLDDDSLPSPSRIPRLSSPIPSEFISEATDRRDASDESIPGYASRVWSTSGSSSASTPLPLESLLSQEASDFMDPVVETRRRRINASAAAGSDSMEDSGNDNMSEISPLARPDNPLLQAIDIGVNDDVDMSDRPPPLINILRPTTPLPPTLASHPQNDPSPPPPVVELDPGRLNLTAEERAQDLDEIWRNSVRLARNMVQEDRDTANNRPGNPNELETAFTRLINSLDGMPASEPLLLRLRDVLTPVEVSRIEGARREVLPTVDLNSPEIDEIEGERESQLFVGSAVPFDNNGFTTGTAPPPSRDYWTRDEIVNVEQAGYDQGVSRAASLGDREHLNIRSNSSSGSENNPLLQTVGEATARETITSMELASQGLPAMPGDSAITMTRSVNQGSENPADILRPDLNEPMPNAPFPLPYLELSNEESHRRVVAYIDSIEREIATRETARSATSASRTTTPSRPGYPLLRTIDEATARNAVSSVINFQTEASVGADSSLQTEAEASPPYPNQNFPRQPENPNGTRTEGPGLARRRPDAVGGRSSRSRIPPSISTHFGEWLLRRHRSSPSPARVRVTVRGGDSATPTSSGGSHELSGSARTRLGLSSGIGSSGPARLLTANSRNSSNGNNGSSSASNSNDQRQRPSTSSYVPLPHPQVYRHPHHAVPNSNFSNNNNNANSNGGEEPIISDSGARFYPGYIPEILITPRARPPTYYTMDAATTAFLSSRIQKWDFSDFYIPDITDRTSGLITASCSLHSDATLDVSSDSEFIAVLQPSDNGSYSAVGIYSLRDETLGASLYTYHFDQNTVSVSISPSCDYVVVGYAGRGPFYRIVHPSRNIGQILSLTREGSHVKLVPVKELFADTQPTLMSINCMHWVPIPGYGIIYGTNTGEVVLLS